jgi:serine/threonine protein kinase
MHDRGIVHRDLKPDNILCSHEWSHVMVADFGSARVVPTPGARSMSPGVTTSLYRAPEMLDEQPGVVMELRDHAEKEMLAAPVVMALPTAYTSKVDVWSAGCVLVEACTGDLTFDSRDTLLPGIRSVCADIAKIEGLDAAARKVRDAIAAGGASRTAVGLQARILDCVARLPPWVSLTVELEKRRESVRLHVRELLCRHGLQTDLVDLLSGMLDPDPARRSTANHAAARITRTA